MTGAGATSGAEVVLGLGNVLRRDDGVGVRVVEALAAARATGTVRLPKDVRVIDGGTVGAGLFTALAGARSLVLVDALAPAGRPGRVTTVDPAAAPMQGAVAELLATAAIAGVLPRQVRLVGVEAASTDGGTELSADVHAAIGPAVMAVLAALEEGGGAAA